MWLHCALMFYAITERMSQVTEWIDRSDAARFQAAIGAALCGGAGI